MTTQTNNLCPRCRNNNSCAIEAKLPAEQCWCMDKTLAHIRNKKLPPSEACYCRQCLQEFARDE